MSAETISILGLIASSLAAFGQCLEAVVVLVGFPILLFQLFQARAQTASIKGQAMAWTADFLARTRFPEFSTQGEAAAKAGNWEAAYESLIRQLSICEFLTGLVAERYVSEEVLELVSGPNFSQTLDTISIMRDAANPMQKIGLETALSFRQPGTDLALRIGSHSSDLFRRAFNAAAESSGLRGGSGGTKS